MQRAYDTVMMLPWHEIGQKALWASLVIVALAVMYVVSEAWGERRARR